MSEERRERGRLYNDIESVAEAERIHKRWSWRAYKCSTAVAQTAVVDEATLAGQAVDHGPAVGTGVAVADEAALARCALGLGPAQGAGVAIQDDPAIRQRR